MPFLFSAVGLLRLPPCDSQPLHSLRLCAHSGKSAFKQMKKKKNTNEEEKNVFLCVQYAQQCHLKCIANHRTSTRIRLCCADVSFCIFVRFNSHFSCVWLRTQSDLLQCPGELGPDPSQQHV